MTNEIQILSVLPTLDSEFPRQITAKRNGEEFVVYANCDGSLFYVSGVKVDDVRAFEILDAVATVETKRQTARRAVKFAELAQFCRRFGGNQ